MQFTNSLTLDTVDSKIGTAILWFIDSSSMPKAIWDERCRVPWAFFFMCLMHDSNAKAEVKPRPPWRRTYSQEQCSRLNEIDTNLFWKVCVCVKRKYFDRWSMNEGGGFTIIGDKAMGKINFIQRQWRMENFDGHRVNHEMRGKQLRDMNCNDRHSNVQNKQSTVLRFPLVRQRKRIEKNDVDVVR